jgi:isocitrate dehydrogenase (NAD+)
MLRQVLTRAASTKVTLIPGDGIGPEVMAATKDLLSAVNAPIEFQEQQISEVLRPDTYSDDIASAVESIKANKICLKGHILAGRSTVNQKLSMQMQMNRDLDAFAHVAHINSYKGVQCKHDNVDFVVVRETTEGEYCGEEHESVPGVVESLKVTTLNKTERIARFAFDYALKHGRKKVTCVHKANIMKKGDGLFMRTCDAIAKEYEGKVQYENMIVDNTCMQLVSNPWQFDVMVMPNLYGNIIENLGAGLIGGAGVLAGAHYGHDVACFGPAARYTYLSGAGQNKANPTAMFMSAGHLLRHVGAVDQAGQLKSAVRSVIAAGNVRTADLGGSASLSEFTNEVIKNL